MPDPSPTKNNLRSSRSPRQDDENYDNMSPNTRARKMREKKAEKYAHDMDATSLYEVTDTLGFDEIEISEMAASFRISDIVGDGFVTYSEIPRILKRLGELPADDTLRRVMNNEIDPDGIGIYNFQTFLKICKTFHQPPATEQVLQEAFQLFDQDKSGTIEAGEIKHVLSCLGDKMSAEEAEEMVSLADKDCTGSIGYQEFIDTILGTGEG